MFRSFVHLVAGTALLAPEAARAQVKIDDRQDTCLLVSTENIVSGNGNCFLYLELSDKPYTFRAGDQLEYDILLPALNPRLQGGVDADLKRENLPEPLASRRSLRDYDIKDQNGIELHGNGILNFARDHWYSHTFALSPVVGCSAER
jgi:hypothetical protein